jgi:hypothetical protein
MMADRFSGDVTAPLDVLRGQPRASLVRDPQGIV